MCRFTLANNYTYKKNDEWVHDVNFINIVCWSRTAENCGQYLKKGSPVRIKGRVDQSYIKKDDGHSLSVVDVIAQSVEFLPWKKRHGDDAELAETDYDESAA
jgi:single-strand DNA-binding protein